MRKGKGRKREGREVGRRGRGGREEKEGRGGEEMGENGGKEAERKGGQRGPLGYCVILYKGKYATLFYSVTFLDTRTIALCVIYGERRFFFFHMTHSKD